MLELSHGEIGWDVFTLEYRIDSPLDVIVTPWASKQYLKVFNFLWRVKRVEFALSTTWRRVQTGARGVISAVGDKLGADWKSARGGVAEMIHFINQLQYYILFEVIEAGWEGLQKAMRKPDATLDTLISAHTTYLRSITRKGLLGGGASAAVDFTAQLHELLKLMLAYRDAVDSLYSFSVAEYSRRQEMAAKIETRTRAGRWGITEADELDSAAASPLFAGHGKSARARKHDSDDLSSTRPLLPTGGAAGIESEWSMLEQIRQRLKTLEVDFRARVNILLGDLAYQPDVDMRFLAVVMNFNDVYAPVKRRRQQKPLASAASVAATGSVAGSVRGATHGGSVKAS
jgi:gamma-tubulin complex component 3